MDGGLPFFLLDFAPKRTHILTPIDKGFGHANVLSDEDITNSSNHCLKCASPQGWSED